jgi:hypothetical protein
MTRSEANCAAAFAAATMSSLLRRDDAASRRQFAPLAHRNSTDRLARRLGMIAERG